jgi:hypothetical protein
MLDGHRFAIFTDGKGVRPLDGRSTQAAVLRGGVYIGHAAADGPSSTATCVKVPSGSQVVALQGGKLISSSPSLPGVAAGVADVQPAVGISFHRMAVNQASCPSELQAVKSSSLTVRTVEVEGASLLCDLARGITRPLVPLVDRLAVFHAIHSVPHPGIQATKRMVSARFVWKGVGRDVGAMCRDCQQCQRGKVPSSWQLLWKPFPCRHASSPTCTWTWWFLYQPLLTATCTC